MTLNPDDVLKQLDAADAPILRLLAECRKEENLPVWKVGPELARKFARLLNRQGHPTIAHEVASRAIKEGWKDDPELIFHRSLALIDVGNPADAYQSIQELFKLPTLPANIRNRANSLTGRILKTMASRTQDPTMQLNRFRESLKFYRSEYDLSKDPFPGINVATLLRITGDAEASRELAEKVRDQVLELTHQPGQERNYWALATLGEAYLLCGDMTAAKGRYSQAVKLAGELHQYGHITSMLRQLRLLRDHLPTDELIGLFRLGPVVVFAGHALDRPGQAMRFPADPRLEAAVQTAIRHELDALEPTVGYCSPGCGSDILFGELMHDRNAEVNLVLPFDENDFIFERVDYGLEKLEHWKKRYFDLKGFLRVPLHAATTEEFLNDQVLYEFAGTFMQGLAITRAEQMGVDPIALVVHDSTAESTTGGLARFMSDWEKTGKELRVIDLAAIRNRVQLEPIVLPPMVPRTKTETPPRTVKAMMFGDVAAFSGLPEAHLPSFFLEFLKIVKAELTIKPTLLAQTWGDGLYIVFDDVVKAADFAIGLLDKFRTFDFGHFKPKAGQKTGVRLGLHTGPVFEGFDAIMEVTNYFGSHVSRAARIEPVTLPGCAYVSEQFAAALTIARDHPFVCEYMGMQPLSKEYDTVPLYRLTVRGADESDVIPGTSPINV